jgi:hypothetical protein
VNTQSEEANKLVEYQQLNAALAQMSEVELKHLLNSIAALQIDLSRLVALLNGAEPIKAVTATQRFLTILNDKINGIFVVKPAKDSPSGRLQNWDNEGGQVDYAPVYHLLHMVRDGRRCLSWTDIGQLRR